ncbi:MAGE family-domain-containing protein [Powellomyces hirtus]|nr:MAGE family-domain-containing protein [Powellomyces hirtus]
MSQRRRSSRRFAATQDEDVEPEDVVDDSAEADQSMVDVRSQVPGQNLSVEELNRKVKDLVRLALASEHRRQPLKREDITKKILKDHPRSFSAVYDGAQSRLRGTFGMEMIELATREKRQPTNQASRRAAAAKSDKVTMSRSYVLRSTLSADEREAVIDWNEEEPSMVLLCVVLGIIHVSGRKIEEGFLLSHLKRLGLRRETRHPVLGTPDDFLADFTKRAYLDKVKVATADADTFEYSWGPRAKVELKEEDLLTFMCEVYPDLTADAHRRLQKDIQRLAGPADPNAASTPQAQPVER